MALVEQRPSSVPVTAACAALGLARASLYRSRRPAVSLPTPSRPRAPSPRRLTEGERQRILDTLHLPEFADQPPTEVYATLLGRGDYIGSIRTIYRVLAESGEVRERRNVRAAQVHPTPSLIATAPNQVWTWDITKLATTEKGVFLQAYVIIDLFSRFVVGWLLATNECKHLAAAMFAEAFVRHGVEPGLVVHADRGSAMKSDTLAQLLADLGASRSFSRPRVSDDNAFSEAQFKTMKYQPDYPGQFTGVPHGRAWLEGFFGWHNDEHHHSGLALFTPAEVFHGRVEEVARVRQAALDAAYAAHPERFPNGPPTVRRPPADVTINPISPEKAAPEVEGRKDAFATAPSDVDAPSSSHLAARPSTGGAEPRGATPLPVDTPLCRAELEQPAAGGGDWSRATHLDMRSPTDGAEARPDGRRAAALGPSTRVRAVRHRSSHAVTRGEADRAAPRATARPDPHGAAPSPGNTRLPSGIGPTELAHRYIECARPLSQTR